MEQSQISENQKTKPKRGRKIAVICVLSIVLALFVALLIHSLLCLFLDGYYPTFGGNRLIAIVSDSMEPEIPTGDMIVVRVPKSADEIKEGTVITFEVKSDGGMYLLTHRVTEVLVDEETGAIAYRTKGDNADGVDRYTPTYDDIVGIYTGKKCGFFGYLFGFLQSSDGARMLIIFVLIIIMLFIILAFVDRINVWRSIAFDAIEKSKSMLVETDNAEGQTVADVLGIVAKTPTDRQDLKRKDKKLRWFMRTGALPRRPYRDDIDDYVEQGGETGKQELAQETAPAPTVAKETAPVAAANASAVENVAADTKEPETSTVQEVAAVASEARSEKEEYAYTFRARLIQNKPESKEFYSIVKNALLSYNEITTIDSKNCERFVFERKTVARISVSGKTLCVYLAIDPDRYADSKYRIFRNKSNTPAKLKITSAQQAQNCSELIDEMMRELHMVTNADYEPQDYYLPYEGIASLMSKGLVKRKNTETSRVSEEFELMSYDMNFSARLTLLKPESKDLYSLIKNELLSYNGVGVKESKNGETYTLGRKTVAKINIRGNTLCLLLALDPSKYADGENEVEAVGNSTTPLKYKLSNESNAQYAATLIAELMAGVAAEKNGKYEPQDYRPSHETIVSLMSKGLATRKLTNKTKVFSVER